jgi:hypothetical protein
MKNSMSLYKIGISVDPKRRCNDIRLASGIHTEILKTFDTTNEARLVEQSLHRHFSSKRKEGEWFRLTKEDLQDIAKTVAQVDFAITDGINNVASSAEELTVEELFNFIASFGLPEDFTVSDCQRLWDSQVAFFKCLLSVSNTKFRQLLEMLLDRGYHVSENICNIDERKPFWAGVTFCSFVIEYYPVVPKNLLGNVSSVYKYETAKRMYEEYFQHCSKYKIEPMEITK